MNQAEIRHLAENLIDELRECPDGTEMTSGQLLQSIGYDPSMMDMHELFSFHDSLFRTAKAHHITLDMSKHEGKAEGLPWNLDFVVKNKKAQIKCPRCGSTNTARILYGMPAWSEELEEKVNSGKIHIGGCKLLGVETEDGTMISLDSKRYCNHCKKEFGTPPVYMPDKDHFAFYPDMVTKIEFSVGGYFGGHTRVTIHKKDEFAIVRVGHTLDEEPRPDRNITLLRWDRIVNKLYYEMYLHEWKKSYEDPDVLDGTQWELIITLGGRKKRTYHGSNAYPAYWKELKALFRPFA